MTYAILYIENGDLVADFDSEDDARTAPHEFVTENPSVRNRVGLLAFDDDGQPVGEFQSARQRSANRLVASSGRRRRRLDCERRRDERGVFLTRHVVEVLRRRQDVGVAHPLLYAADVGLGDHPRAECVAEVVEAQRAQAGTTNRREVPPPERTPV